MKVLTFGEIMLRLKAPGHERFFQSPMLEATFGGGEANVAVSLANYGLNQYEDKQSTLEFAVAASCLKHSVIGDFNRVSVSDVEKLMGGDGTGRV